MNSGGDGRLLVVVLIWGLVAACSGSGSDGGQTTEPSPSTQTSAPAARDYWPTDGWRTAAPQDHGIDPAALAKVNDEVPESHPQVRSVLVIRHGYLVYEQYWRGLDATAGHDVRSVTKSFVDPRLAAVTVKQLLTMTSGLAGDDESFGADPGVGLAMARSPDWVRHILGRRLKTEPGTQFAYSNATSHLLSAIVANATGQSTLAYARARLFDPLGIRTDGIYEPVLSYPLQEAALQAYQQSAVAWPVDPQGYHFGAAFLRLPARDLAKLGFLYLNGGRWGDQYIHVIPALDLVTVVTSEAEMNRSDAHNLIINTIAPAVTG